MLTLGFCLQNQGKSITKLYRQKKVFTQVLYLDVLLTEQPALQYCPCYIPAYLPRQQNCINTAPSHKLSSWCFRLSGDNCSSKIPPCASCLLVRLALTPWYKSSHSARSKLGFGAKFFTTVNWQGFTAFCKRRWPFAFITSDGWLIAWHSLKI